MPTPLPLTDAASDDEAWHELEDSFATLGLLARSSVAPEHFYRRLLEESVRALSAVGGAVWLHAVSGALQPVVQIRWQSADADSEEARRGHEALLSHAAASGRVITREPGVNGHALLVAPVQILRQDEDLAADWSLQRSVPAPPQDDDSPAATLAIIEIVLRADASPAAYRGYEQFLAAVRDIAADFHAHTELRRLRHEEGYRRQLVHLAGQVHRSLSLKETAYAVTNEGRRVIGCDRLSVLAATGQRCRLLATSGVSHVERRGAAARELERLAELVHRTSESAWYADGQCDALPPIAAALERHAEASTARQVAAVPLTARSEEQRAASGPGSPRPAPCFVLVAEQFDARGGELHRDRLVEVAEVCTTALHNALEMDRLPLGWLLRPLASAKQAVAQHVTRTAFAAALLAGLVAALALIPADFTVEATGSLQPVVRRDVFAPRSGLVDEVLIRHGDDVQSGQPLARLRDPLLELELKRVYGELETAQRQIDAVRATRTNRAVRDASPADGYRLSAEERELAQRLTNLRDELELLERERKKLLVTSPIAGRVLTWDVANRLIARPVDRGDVLLTVADMTADWQLELDVPDDRIGHVMAAQTTLQPELPVQFRLSSDDRELHVGHLSEVCLIADVDPRPGAAPSPTVLVKVAFDADELAERVQDELRPGVSARGQIACGRRSLGYVWLHDVWDAVVGWLRF